MTPTIVMWLVLGGALCLVGTMQVVLGSFTPDLESGRRTSTLILGALILGLGLYLLYALARPEVNSAMFLQVLGGTIIAGVVVAVAVLARKKPID